MSENRSSQIAKNPPTPTQAPTKVTTPTQIPNSGQVPKPGLPAIPLFVPGAVFIWGIKEGFFPQSTSDSRDMVNPLTKKPYKNQDEYNQVEGLNTRQRQATDRKSVV